jgi:hypothetical protein
MHFNLIEKMKLIHNKFGQLWGWIDNRRKLEYWDCFFNSITQSYQYLFEFMESVDCGNSNPNDTSRDLRINRCTEAGCQSLAKKLGCPSTFVLKSTINM